MSDIDDADATPKYNRKRPGLRPAVAFSLPFELVGQLTDLAKERGMSRSRLVEEMVRAYLG